MFRKGKIKLNPQINLPFNSEIFLPWQSYLEYKLHGVCIPGSTIYRQCLYIVLTLFMEVMRSKQGIPDITPADKTPCDSENPCRHNPQNDILDKNPWMSVVVLKRWFICEFIQGVMSASGYVRRVFIQGVMSAGFFYSGGYVRRGFYSGGYVRRVFDSGGYVRLS